MSTLTIETVGGMFWAGQRDEGFLVHIPNIPLYDMEEVCDSLAVTPADIEYRVLGAIAESCRARESSRYKEAPNVGRIALSC